MSFTPTSDRASQPTRAQDQFALVRRLGDVIMKKQVAKRKEISVQVEALSTKLASDTETLFVEAKQQANNLRSNHIQKIKTLKDVARSCLNADRPARLQDISATTEATILASGGVGSVAAAVSTEVIHLDMDELLCRAETLSQANAKTLREVGRWYHDVEDS
ncbi:unnamed protein product [Tilletia controversa]|nr:unnamed protein product [Tilletia controversa]